MSARNLHGNKRCKGTVFACHAQVCPVSRSYFLGYVFGEFPQAVVCDGTEALCMARIDTAHGRARAEEDGEKWLAIAVRFLGMRRFLSL